MRLNLYHCTYSRHWNSILQQGLLSKPPTRNWVGEHPAIRERIYLCSNPRYAPHSSFVVAIKSIDIENLFADEDCIYPYWDISFHHVTENECPRKNEKERAYLVRATREMGLCGAIASLVIAGSVSHRGDIGREHIGRAVTNVSKFSQIPQQSYTPAFYNIAELLQSGHKAKAQLKVYRPEYAIRFPDNLWTQVNKILRTSRMPIRDLTRIEKKRKDSRA